MRKSHISNAAYIEFTAPSDASQAARPQFVQSSFFDVDYVPQTTVRPSRPVRTPAPGKPTATKLDTPYTPNYKKKKRPKRSDRIRLSEIIQVFDDIDLEPVLSALKPPYRTGRRGYSLKTMLIAHYSRYLLDVQYVADWVEMLQDNPSMAATCGIKGRVPSESTFSRFNAVLSKIPDVIMDLMHRLVNEIKVKIDVLHASDPDTYPEFGKEVAIDATAIRAYSNPNRRHGKHRSISDKDAKWGMRHKADSPDGQMVYFFGYKGHAIVDANYNIPLTLDVSPGNRHDIRFLKPLYEQAERAFPWYKPDAFMGDKGYDSQAMHRYLRGKGSKGIVPPRKTLAHDGMYDGIFDANGNPTCMGMQAMEYVGTNPANGHLTWRCRAGGCHLKEGGTKAIKHCDDVIELDPNDNPRVMGDVPRDSKAWKRLYRKRWSIERVFNSLKYSRLLESHRYRGIAKVKSHAITSAVTLLATTLAHLRRGQVDLMAWMRARPS